MNIFPAFVSLYVAARCGKEEPATDAKEGGESSSGSEVFLTELIALVSSVRADKVTLPPKVQGLLEVEGQRKSKCRASKSTLQLSSMIEISVKQNSISGRKKWKST